MPRVKLTKILIFERRSELIWALYEEGWTDSEIGEVFNLDRTSIFRIREFIRKRQQKQKKA